MPFTDYLDDNLGDDYKDIGVERIYHCPFCSNNRDYKLYVANKPHKPEKHELWECKRCGSAGNPTMFVMKYENIDYKTARNTLELYGLSYDPLVQLMAEDDSLTEEEALYMMLKGLNIKEPPVSQIKRPPRPPKGYRSLLDNYYSQEARPFFNYLIRRGTTLDDIKLHDIGYIIEGEITTTSGKNVTIRNHVVFLTKDFNGDYLYWNTRSIERSPFIKTFNAPSNSDEYGKSDVLFNLNNAIHSKMIVVAEGVFDAMTIPNNSGIASFGKALSDVQIDLLLEAVRPHQTIYLFLDDDAIDYTNRVASKIANKHPKTYIVMNGTGMDINDLGPDKAMDMIINNSTMANGQGELLARLNLM